MLARPDWVGVGPVACLRLIQCGYGFSPDAVAGRLKAYCSDRGGALLLCRRQYESPVECL